MNIPFVEEIKKTHCKGCLTAGSCTNCETINCWLRKTYLPAGIWQQAAMQDVENNLVDNLADAINRELIKHITIK